MSAYFLQLLNLVYGYFLYSYIFHFFDNFLKHRLTTIGNNLGFKIPTQQIIKGKDMCKFNFFLFKKGKTTYFFLEYNV